MTPEQLTQVRDVVSAAQSILVLLPVDPSYDQAAAGLGLADSLLRMGKEVIVATPFELDEDVSGLHGLEWVKTQLGNQNLTMTFPYDEAAVDKVSYHIDEENNQFYLVIKPQKGARPLDAQSVQFSYTGADADLIFLIGVHSFEALEHLYSGFEELYQRSTTIVMHTFEPSIGLIKLNVGGLSSMSEGMCRLLYSWQDMLSPEACTNLLSGIEDVTDGFRSLAVTADTFETVARLMRDGARRQRRARTGTSAQPAPAGSANPFAAALSKSRSGEINGEVVLSAPPVNVPVGEADAVAPAAQAGAAAPVVQAQQQTAEPDLTEQSEGSKKPKKNKKPGGLDYQPNGFGPGGTG